MEEELDVCRENVPTHVGRNGYVQEGNKYVQVYLNSLHTHAEKGNDMQETFLHIQ